MGEMGLTAVAAGPGALIGGARSRDDLAARWPSLLLLRAARVAGRMTIRAASSTEHGFSFCRWPLACVRRGLCHGGPCLRRLEPQATLRPALRGRDAQDPPAHGRALLFAVRCGCASLFVAGLPCAPWPVHAPQRQDSQGLQRAECESAGGEPSREEPSGSIRSIRSSAAGEPCCWRRARGACRPPALHGSTAPLCRRSLCTSRCGGVVCLPTPAARPPSLLVVVVVVGAGGR